jgi:hypothetical protein
MHQKSIRPTVTRIKYIAIAKMRTVVGILDMILCIPVAWNTIIQTVWDWKKKK